MQDALFFKGGSQSREVHLPTEMVVSQLSKADLASLSQGKDLQIQVQLQSGSGDGAAVSLLGTMYELHRTASGRNSRDYILSRLTASAWDSVQRWFNISPGVSVKVSKAALADSSPPILSLTLVHGTAVVASAAPTPASASAAAAAAAAAWSARATSDAASEHGDLLLQLLQRASAVVPEVPSPDLVSSLLGPADGSSEDCEESSSSSSSSSTGDLRQQRPPLIKAGPAFKDRCSGLLDGDDPEAIAALLLKLPAMMPQLLTEYAATGVHGRYYYCSAHSQAHAMTDCRHVKPECVTQAMPK